MKITYIQKVVFFVSCFSSTFVFSQTLPAQANTQWKINGNIADSTHFIGTKNESPLKFRSFDIERMRITSDGMVGIGTKTPKELLDVNGNAILRGKLSLPNLIQDNLITGKDIIFSDAAGLLTKGSISQLITEGYAPKGCIANQNGDILKPMWENGLNKIYTACPQVKVGIGTDAPRVKLDVIGDSYASSISLGGADPNTIGGMFFHLKAIYPNSNQKLFLIEGSNNDELFSVSNNGAMNINSLNVNSTSGTDPAFLVQNSTRRLLQVSDDGTLRSRKIIVDVYNWPDYVFEKKYELRPISEVKKYIFENGHLPDVPTQKAVEEEGLDVSEMNKILLKKVEELTLYLIQQDEKIKELEKKIKK